MLDLDWKKSFAGLNLVKVLQQFYEFVPKAIIEAIIVQMKYTNATELNDICTNQTKPLKNCQFCFF